MKKLTALTLALGLVLTATNVATAAVPEGVKLAPVQSYTGNLLSVPSTLDPDLINDNQSSKAAQLIFDTLVRQDNTGKFVPCAAESFSASADGLTWTFKLRPNATWQDGKPVVAADFLYSFRRLNDPKTASAYGNYLAMANVVNAQDVLDGKKPVDQLGIETPDDHTLVFHLAEPTPWFPQMLTYVATAPVRKDLIEKYGDSWTSPEHIVGNGPFKLKEYIINDHISYTKYQDYWDAKNVILNDAKYIFINNLNTSYFKFLAGEIYSTIIPSALKDRILKEYPKEVVQAPALANFYIAFNNKEIPTVIRKAITLLVDKKFLVNRILKAGIATSIFAPTYIADGQDATEAAYFNQPMTERRAEAVKILQEAGYSKDKPFEITFLTDRSPTADRVNNALRAWIQQGSTGMIKFVADTQESKIYYEKAQKAQYGARLGGWGADYDQASTFYNILQCGNTNNSTLWCSKKYTDLVNQANHTQDATERAKLYAQANSVIQEEYPVDPLFFKQVLSLVSPALGGYNPKLSNVYVRDFYIIADKHIGNK